MTVRVLSIAGLDTGNGAGLGADLKTITALGGWGLSAATALTAQNTQGIKDIHPVPPSFIRRQIDAVLSDMGADAVKTGMLATAEQVRETAQCLNDHNVRNLVVDPVFRSTSGTHLSAPEAVQALRSDLLPLARMVTPNLAEAAILAGRPVRNLEEMETAARIIRDLGPDEVLIKGGHLAGRPVDLLFKGTRSHLLDGPRIETEGAHGTGCVFSAALATFLGQGMESYPAAVRAKDFTTGAISRAVRLGAGGPSADPFAHAALFTERESVLEALRTALDRLLSQPLAHLVPEIRSNLGFALPQASRTEDVAAVQGRITTLGRRLLALSEPAFGASRHVARVILAAMSANPCLRSAMNIRYSPEIVQVCQALGFQTVCFERSAEPEAVKAREGSTLTWGTRRALEGGQGTADVVYDLGEVGKEPVIRVLGTDPGQVVEKVIRIHEALVEAGRA